MAKRSRRREPQATATAEFEAYVPKVDASLRAGCTVGADRTRGQRLLSKCARLTEKPTLPVRGERRQVALLGAAGQLSRP
jgi:hypothetical protein